MFMCMQGYSSINIYGKKLRIHVMYIEFFTHLLTLFQMLVRVVFRHIVGEIEKTGDGNFHFELFTLDNITRVYSSQKIIEILH